MKPTTHTLRLLLLALAMAVLFSTAFTRWQTTSAQKPSLPQVAYLTSGEGATLKIFQIELEDQNQDGDYEYQYTDCANPANNRSAGIRLYHEYSTDYISGARIRLNETTGEGKVTAIQVYGYGHIDGPLIKAVISEQSGPETYFRRGPPWSAVGCPE